MSMIAESPQLDANFHWQQKKMGTDKQKKNAKEIHSKTIVRFIE